MTDKTRIVTLDNGAVIVARKFADSQTAHIQWSLMGGSHAERPNEHGVAHYLEHTLVNPDLIYKPIKNVGANVNAYTSYDNIVMWARVMPEHAAMTQHRLFEHGLIKPAFSQADFDREMSPIQMEITQRMANPDNRLHLKANSVMFGTDPRGHDICGTQADVASHDFERLKNFFARSRTPNGIIALAAGKFDQRQFFKSAEAHLRDVPALPANIIAPSIFRSGEAIFVEPPANNDLSLNEQPVGLMARFKAVSAANPERIAFSLMCTMLSDGLDSPLMVELREKRGLVYGAGAGLSLWDNDGTVQVSLKTSRAKIEQATQVLADTLAVVPSFLTAERFERTRNTVMFHMADSTEGSDDWAQRAVNDMRLFGRIRERSEIVQAYAAVTLADVQRAAATFTQPAFVAAMGPIEGLSFKPVFDKAMKLTA